MTQTGPTNGPVTSSALVELAHWLPSLCVHGQHWGVA